MTEYGRTSGRGKGGGKVKKTDPRPLCETSDLPFFFQPRSLATVDFFAQRRQDIHHPNEIRPFCSTISYGVAVLELASAEGDLVAPPSLPHASHRPTTASWKLRDHHHSLCGGVFHRACQWTRQGRPASRMHHRLSSSSNDLFANAQSRSARGVSRVPPHGPYESCGPINARASSGNPAQHLRPQSPARRPFPPPHLSLPPATVVGTFHDPATLSLSSVPSIDDQLGPKRGLRTNIAPPNGLIHMKPAGMSRVLSAGLRRAPRGRYAAVTRPAKEQTNGDQWPS